VSTSAQHKRWNNAGISWKLARPLAVLRDRLRGYGYTVYDIGNNDHMDHQPPEDHTPYSETGWPGATPYGWVTAIDIMPTGALPSLQRLGAQIFADKQSGDVPWLKYMNWGPTSNNSAVHDSWQPNYARKSSSDTGHIHISCRSDSTLSTTGDDYDPVARLNGRPVLHLEAGMNIIGTPDGARYLQTPNGPVAITWSEWVASFGENKSYWPPVLVVANADRVNEFCPIVAPVQNLTAKLSDVSVSGSLHFGE